MKILLYSWLPGKVILGKSILGILNTSNQKLPFCRACTHHLRKAPATSDRLQETLLVAIYAPVGHGTQHFMLTRTEKKKDCSKKKRDMTRHWSEPTAGFFWVKIWFSKKKSCVWCFSALAFPPTPHKTCISPGPLGSRSSQLPPVFGPVLSDYHFKHIKITPLLSNYSLPTNQTHQPKISSITLV